MARSARLEKCGAGERRQGGPLLAENHRHGIGVEVSVPPPAKTSVLTLEFEAEGAIKLNRRRIVGQDRQLNLAQARPFRRRKKKRHQRRANAPALSRLADASQQGAAMAKQAALDVKAAEGDDLPAQNRDGFELLGGADSVQPAVDLIPVGRRSRGRRPFEELAFVE